MKPFLLTQARREYNLNPKQPMMFDTTHPTNMIKIKGILPQDKEILIDKANKYMEVMK